MNTNLKGRYFNTMLNVDATLLKAIWGDPKSIGGGAESFKTNANSTCWKTSEGWGFVRHGSEGFGKVQFVDPMPGKGCYEDACKQGAFQYEGQRKYPHGSTTLVA